MSSHVIMSCDHVMSCHVQEVEPDHGAGEGEGDGVGAPGGGHDEDEAGMEGWDAYD